jgi:DNA-binding MarR family transcriptional regulator
MSKSHLKTSITHTTLAIDSETGELMDREVKTVRYLANNKEEFYLIYSSLIGLLQKMTLPEIKVYCYLIEKYQIGSPIALTRTIKEIIAEKQGLSIGTVKNTIPGLWKKRLIYPIGRGTYKLNPRFAFKGSTSERNALLKVALEVECPNC